MELGATAEARLRAGFMLIPEIGASTVMQAATRAPAKRPVRRARRAVFDARSTTLMSAKLMTHSATNATDVPAGPGIVVTYWTDGWATDSPSRPAATRTPASPPAAWARV